MASAYVGLPPRRRSDRLADALSAMADDLPSTRHLLVSATRRLWGRQLAPFRMACPCLAGIALACVSLRRSFAPVAVGVATIAVLLLSGVVAYAGDHNTARGTLKQRAGDPPDWLDRSGLGPADYLQLPGGSPYFGWLLEAWNRDFRRPVHLVAGATGSRLQGDKRERRSPSSSTAPVPPEVLVVNDTRARSSRREVGARRARLDCVSAPGIAGSVGSRSA